MDAALVVIGDLTTKVEKLQAQVEWLSRKLFGKSSEKVDPGQLALAFDQLAKPEVLPASEPVEADSGEPRTPRKKHPGRRALPKSLPRGVKVHEVDPKDLVCDVCHETKVEFARDVTEKIDIEPARVIVVVHERPKLSCPRCQNGVVMAPMPPSVLEKGLAEAGAIAHTVVSRIGDRLPLHRLEKILARSGVHIDRNTLQDWFDAAANSFESLVAFMKKSVLSSPIIQSDDTRVQVLARPKGSYTGYLWCYVSPGDEVVYDFRENRGGEGPRSFLGNFRGYLQADAFSGYDQVYASGLVTEVGCMAHTRRKFFDARERDPGHVDPIMKVIGEL